MVREIYLGNVGGECAQHLREACKLSASWRIMDEPGSAVKVGFATPPLSSTSSTTATDLTYSTTKNVMHYMTGGSSPTSAAPTASPSPRYTYAGAKSRNRGHVEDAAAAVQISRSNSTGATPLNRGHSEQACGAVMASRSTPAGATPLNRGHLEDATLAVQIACPTHIASTALKGEHLQDVCTATSSPRRTHSPASSLKRCSPISPIATTSSPRTTYSVFMPQKRGISEGAAAAMSPTSHTHNTSTRLKRSSPTSPVSGMPSPRTTYSVTVPVKHGIPEHTAAAKSSLWTTFSDAVPVKRGISEDTPAAPSSPRTTYSDASLVKRGLSEDTAAAISSLRTTFSATTRVKRGLSEDTTALSSPRTTFADAVQPKRGTLNDALSSFTSVFSPRPDVTKPSARACLYDIRSRSTRPNTLRDTTRHLPARGDGIEYIATPAPTSGTCSTTAELAANGHAPTDDPQCYGEDNEDDGDANSARNGIVATGLDHQMGTALESKKMADTWVVTGSPRSPSSHSRAERFPSTAGSVRSPDSNSCAERASENAGNAQPQSINDRTEQVYCGAESSQHPGSNGPAKRFLQHAGNPQPADSNGRVGQHVYNNGSSDAIMHALPEKAATSRAPAWTSPTLEKIDCSRAGLPMLPGPILQSMTARKTRNPAQNRAPTAAHVSSMASTPDIPEVTLIEVNAQRTRSVKGVPLHSANRMHDRMFLSLKDANMAVDNADTQEGKGGLLRSASEKVFDAEKAAETGPTTQAVHPAPSRLASFHSSLPLSCSHSPKPESARVLSKGRSPAQRAAASAESPDRVSSLHHDHNERTVTTWHARTISPSDVSGTVARRPDMSRVPSRSLTCARTVPAAVMPILVEHARESTDMHPVSHTSPVHPVSHTSPVHRSRGSRPGNESVDGMGGRTGPGDVSPECKELLSVSEFVPCDAIVDFDIAAGCPTRSTVVVRPSLLDNHPTSPRAEWSPQWSDARTTDVLDSCAFSSTQPRTTFQHADHAAPRCAQDERHALRALSAHHVSCSLTPVTNADPSASLRYQATNGSTKEKRFRNDDWTNDHGTPLDTMATIVHDDTDIARQSTGLLDATDVRARDAIGSGASMPSRLPDQCLTHVSAHGVLDVAHMHFTNGCLPDDCRLPTVYCILASRCSLGPQFSLRSTMDHLCVLDLSGNALSTFPQLDGCPKLKVLSLEDNHIATFPTSHSNVPQPRLVELNVGHNQLTSLQGLEHFPLLRRVNIAHNCIANISHLRVLSTFPYLTLCALKGNPFTRVHGFKVTVSNIVPPTITLDCPRIKHGGNNAISTVSTPKRQSTAASDSFSGGTFFSDAGLRAALADASASGFHALLASLWKDGKLGSADADSTTTNAVARIRTRARDSSARRSMSGKGHNMSAGKAKSRRLSTSLAPKLRTTTYSHMSSLRERVLDKFTTPSITVDHSVWANQIC